MSARPPTPDQPAELLQPSLSRRSSASDLTWRTEKTKRWPIVDWRQVKSIKDARMLFQRAKILLPKDCIGFLVFDAEAGRFKRLLKRYNRYIKGIDMVEACTDDEKEQQPGEWLIESETRVISVLRSPPLTGRAGPAA